MIKKQVWRMVLVGAIAVALAGCSERDRKSASAGQGEVTRTSQAIGVPGTGIDPAHSMGDVRFRFPAQLPTREGPVPITVYAGVGAATPTRLSINAFADLRQVQARLPTLMSGEVESACRQEISVEVVDVAAAGDRVVARGRVNADFYTCRRSGTPEEQRGFRLISQRIDVVAQATAAVRKNCIEFSVLDLELDPSGLLGAMANLFGLTTRVRNAILSKAGEVLAENPICPNLPSELAALKPAYDAGGIREIGQGGVGAALGGTIDTSATTLLELLAFAQKRQAAGGGQ